MTQTGNQKEKTFVPTSDMITAAENVFLAMALEQQVRPIVEAYQRKILAERTWEVAPSMRKVQDVLEYVTDIKYAWLMSDSDFAVYRRRCNEERIAANLSGDTVDPSDDGPENDHCPLLSAEDVLRKAKFALADAMAGVTNIPGKKAVTLRASDYEKLIELSLRVLAPFVQNPLVSGAAAQSVNTALHAQTRQP